jgi:hypothetical protein
MLPTNIRSFTHTSERRQTMPISREVMAGFPQFSGSGAELQGVMQYIIAGVDIEAFFIELFPSAISGIPVPPALMPGTTILYANQFESKPFLEEEDVILNQGSLAPIYAYAVVKVTYKTRTFNTDNPGGAIITRKKSIGGEFMTMPNCGLRWAEPDSAGTTIVNDNVKAGKIIPTRQLHVTLHRVPNPNESIIDNLIGKVNSDKIEGAPVGSCLFLGADMTQDVTADGTQPWTIELKLSQRPFDWNFFMHPETGDFKRMKTASGKDVYEYANFSDIYEIGKAG